MIKKCALITSVVNCWGISIANFWLGYLLIMVSSASHIQISSPDSLQPHLFLVSWCNLSISFKLCWAISQEYFSGSVLFLCPSPILLPSYGWPKHYSRMLHNILCKRLNAQPHFIAIIILHQTHSYSNNTATSAVCSKGALLLIKAAASLFAPSHL